MSDSDFSMWDDVEFSLDYDATRWQIVPQDGTGVVMGRGKRFKPKDFGREVAQAWATDCGRSAEWADLLARMLEYVARSKFSEPPYALLAYIRDIPAAAPFVQEVTLRLRFDEPDAAAFAEQLASFRPDDSIEPPTLEKATTSKGTDVHVVTYHGAMTTGRSCCS